MKRFGLLRHEQDPQEDALAELEGEERRATARAELLRVPSRQREALALRLNGGRSTSEIAEIMGLRPASVRSLLSKGLANLSKQRRRTS